jgi:hypothetical protein
MPRSRVFLPAIVAVDIVLFLGSGIPRFRDADSGVDLVVGDVLWFGFLVGLLAVVILAVVAIARRYRLHHQGETR